jgi:hypothetical protein
VKYVFFFIPRRSVSPREFQHFNTCINYVYDTGNKLTLWTPAVMVMRLQVLSTHQEVIPATNAIDAHAQDSVVNDELLLPILKAFSERARTLHAILSA